jgi:indolepyruvate ferredoxin oxidoreductase
MEGLLPQLNASNRDAAVVVARVPDQIRGFGHVKARHLADARVQWSLAIEQFGRADSVESQAPN